MISFEDLEDFWGANDNDGLQLCVEPVAGCGVQEGRSSDGLLANARSSERACNVAQSS
jgi:hypothetical protein